MLQSGQVPMPNSHGSNTWAESYRTLTLVPRPAPKSLLPSGCTQVMCPACPYLPALAQSPPQLRVHLPRTRFLARPGRPRFLCFAPRRRRNPVPWPSSALSPYVQAQGLSMRRQVLLPQSRQTPPLSPTPPPLPTSTPQRPLCHQEVRLPPTPCRTANLGIQPRVPLRQTPLPPHRGPPL